MDEPSPTAVVRDLPWASWVGGTMIGGLGGLLVLSQLRVGGTHGILVPAVMSGVGLLGLALPSALTIRVDRKSGMLYLNYRSLLRKTGKQIPLREIESIDIEDHRVLITERDGRTTPLRLYQETKAGGKHGRLAKRLRDLIGVGGSDGPTLRTLTGQDERVNRQIRRQQEALTGPDAEMRESGGVRWNIQSAGMGKVPVTRWFSPDYQTDGTFVYVAQIPARNPTGGGMIGDRFTSGWVGKQAARASMGLYGFVGDDVRGSQAAQVIALDAPLDRDFMAFSPDEAAARQILRPPVARALANWAARHPLKAVRVGNGTGQLAVLFSSTGVYAATIGLMDTTKLAELGDIGTELVKHQRQNAS